MSPRMRKRWQWIPSSVDSLPVNAVEGGQYRGNKVYVARAHHGGSITVGKFSVPERMAVIAWQGVQYDKGNYEILVAQPGKVKWVDYDPQFSLIPCNAIEGGYSELFQEKLFVGRALHLGDMLVGSVHGRRRVCTVAWEGHVLEFHRHFQLLVEGG